MPSINWQYRTPMGSGRSMAQWVAFLRLARLARVLAFVATIVLASGLHPPHANASGATSDHSHFGATCLKADLQESGAKKIGGKVPLGHADCSQIFDPLVRTPVDWAPAFSAAVTPALRAEPFRHFVSPFDPPPPRRRV